MIFTQILDQLKMVIFSMYSKKSENEALVAYDFKLINFKSALMKLSFSPLANWPLFILALIFYYNPFRYQFQLLAGFSNIVAFLYSPQWAMGLAIGIIFSYFIGLINIPIAVVMYFVSQGEIHTILGFSILVGVFTGRILKYFKFLIKLEGRTKKIILYFNIIQILSLATGIFLNSYIYELMSAYGFFSRTLFAFRFEYLVISLFVFYACQFLVNSVWGHFYSRTTEDISKINIFYSTAQILQKTSISHKTRTVILQQARSQIHELALQLESEQATLIPKNILASAHKENNYLDLTIDVLADKK